MESRNVMKKYIGILAKITGFILIVILAVNIILPLIKRNPYDRKCKKSIVLSTFDLRPDDSGMKIIAALYTAAERGVQVQILIDGIYQKLFLEKSPVFQALAAHQNVEVGIYNPVMNRKVKGKETK